MTAAVAFAFLSAGFVAGCASNPTETREIPKEQRVQLMLQLANGALNEGDPTYALQTLMQVEQMNPNLPELHHAKALAYFTKKNYEMAMASIKRAIALKPDYPDAYTSMGKFLMDMGQLDEAIVALKKPAANLLYPDAYRPLTTLGVIHYKRGEFGKAAAYLDQAIEGANSRGCLAWYYRGHLRLKEGRYQEAVRDYASASSDRCGAFPDAALAIGIAYERQGETRKARKKYLEVQDRYPNTAAADQAVNRLKYLP